jgi:uncharacterized protein (DUF433 family)
MRLEDYFEFLSPDDIRIRGHRIGIDNVLEYYLQGSTPEQILEHFPSLTLEQVYATLTYYLHNKDEVEQYMERLNTWREQHYRESLLTESMPVVQRLRTIQAQREKANFL